MKKTFLLLTALILAGAAQAQERVLVQLENSADYTGARNAVAGRFASRMDLKDWTEGFPFLLFIARSGQDVEQLQEDLIADPAVADAEDDARYFQPEGEASKGSTVASIGSRSTLYAMNTGMLQQIRFQPGWANSFGIRNVRVAILDTGMSAQRPELWNKTVASLNLIEPGQPAYDMPRGHNSNQNGTIDEGTGHGSMVAGIIDQVAPLVQLVVVRAADSDGVTSAWNLIKGLAFAAQNRAEVVNISFGSYEGIPMLGDAIEWFEDNNYGMTVVAPVGNDNIRELMEPADRSSVIAVAGVDDEDEKASFSNWDGDVRVSAPATGIRSYWWDGKLAAWDGTSFAAPLVAGAIADGLRFRRTLAPWKVREMFDRFGDDIDGSNPGYADRLGKRLNITKLSLGMRRLR
jgi:subtilisin family serine protease